MRLPLVPLSSGAILWNPSDRQSRRATCCCNLAVVVIAPARAGAKRDCGVQYCFPQGFPPISASARRRSHCRGDYFVCRWIGGARHTAGALVRHFLGPPKKTPWALVPPASGRKSGRAHHRDPGSRTAGRRGIRLDDGVSALRHLGSSRRAMIANEAGLTHCPRLAPSPTFAASRDIRLGTLELSWYHWPDLDLAASTLPPERLWSGAGHNNFGFN